MMDMVSSTSSAWAESSSGSADLVLVTRPPAFGLPTACPACLPAYLYLRLAGARFDVHVTAVEPDSEDLPSVEYGENVGFASENGGVVEFLREEKIVDLDAGLNERERAELETCKAMMQSWVADASAYEVWMRDNSRQCKTVYFSELPWGLVQALDWKQRLAVMQRLEITPENTMTRTEELYKKASNAYSALSILLSDQKYFFNDRPTSLDALVLGHLLFHLRVPLEVSTLKEAILKHQNLVDYAEHWSKYLLGEEGNSIDSSFRPKPPHSSHASPPRQGPKERDNPEKERREKDIFFKKRAKYFVIAQVTAVLMYVVFAGYGVDDDGEDDGGDDDD